MKRPIIIATGLVLGLLVAELSSAQQNNIVASTSWTETSEGWGGYQLRHWSGHPIPASFSANHIVNGNGLDILESELNRARASSPSVFTTWRLMYNYHRVNRANEVGLTFKTFRHWDGSTGFTVDYDNPANISRIEEIETLVRDRVGHLLDAIQLGFGLLQENNFGPDPPPVSIDGMFAYYEAMNRVWGKKLQVNIGGTFGPVSDPAWTRVILTRIAETGRRFFSDFQDSWGRERWTQYNRVREIWTSRGIEPPIISWREVTGGCNDWTRRPDVTATPAQLLTEAVENRQSFSHNMGCRFSYPSAAAFTAQTMTYLPAQVREYRRLVHGVTPPPVPELPDSTLWFRVSELEAMYQELELELDSVRSWMQLAPVYSGGPR